MPSVRLALALAVAAQGAFACGGDDHSHARRAYPSTKLRPPTRPLEWGDFNVMHTTDTHGWLLGHQKESWPEPNYSGDLGDFASFVAHMKKIAEEKDVDLLLVDSGDLHDGTGISDGFPAGGVDAHDSNEFLKQIPYDIMAIGNHELYIYENTLDMYNNFAPDLNGRYLSSNVNITVFGENNETINVPVGERFAKFTTRKGRRVTSFGVLFDFTGNDDNTTVQTVADMVKEDWFVDAIQEEPDVFLLVGHMPVREDNWPLVFDAIRTVHPTTPILIFGGHTHIRDCVQLDGRSMALESGRYMETLGWMSANLNDRHKKNITFSRRYLDPNRVTYQFHTLTSNHTFDTEEGANITQGLLDLAEQYDLDYLYGTAPMDYTIDRVPYPSNNSLLSLFVSEATPLVLSANNTANSTRPALFLTNSGSQRFDLYKGPFTKNDQLTASPFVDAWLYMPEVEYGVAKQVLDIINADGSNNRRRSMDDQAWERASFGLGRDTSVDKRYRAWLRDMEARAHAEQDRDMRRDADHHHHHHHHDELSIGYVTYDSCPGVGDDTEHEPLESYTLPDFIQSNVTVNGTAFDGIADETLVDFVFVDFIDDQIVETLNSIVGEEQFSVNDLTSYSPVLTNELLGFYAQMAWN
ncbi:Metallo-dependent phosphatase-like protein [Schizophyllum amplum]|uniref:Metallo-dependent phosphatase-like protein n=1 Tax=Schizophyllum amplum TaxID=97359 RepID=A0A550CVP8_9AGAR|nr:Metallo-dependent phosphatase-like protein [Auriculariopsis ampla]